MLRRYLRNCAHPISLAPVLRAPYAGNRKALSSRQSFSFLFVSRPPRRMAALFENRMIVTSW